MTTWFIIYPFHSCPLFSVLSAAPGFTCLPYHSLSDSSWGPGPPSHLIKDDFSFMIKFKTPPISGVSHYQPEHKGLVSPTPMLPKSLTEMKIPSTDDLAAMSIDKLGSSWPVGWLVGWLVDDHCERRPASPPTCRLTHQGCCALHLVVDRTTQLFAFGYFFLNICNYRNNLTVLKRPIVNVAPAPKR